MSDRQLALSSPTKHVRTDGLTDRQRSVLTMLRGRDVRARDVEALRVMVDYLEPPVCYSDGGAMLRRLERRGLVQRLRPGVFRVVRVGERRRI